MQILFPRGILLFASDGTVTRQIYKLRIKRLEFTSEFHEAPTIDQKSTEQIVKYILIEENRKSSILDKTIIYRKKRKSFYILDAQI